MRELLNGVYDLHIHTSPDVVPRKYSDLELARRLAERGMAGCAIKCHYFDTAARAGLLMAQFPQLDVAGGVTLNRSVGGLNPDAVERSAQAGGRMVWFPTLEAQSYQRYQHRCLKPWRCWTSPPATTWWWERATSVRRRAWPWCGPLRSGTAPSC